MPKRKALVTSLIAICSTFSVQAKPPVDITLVQIGRFETGVYLEGAAEIVAFDAKSEKLFVVNAQAATIDILDLSDPTVPDLVGVIDVSTVLADAGGVNSVAVRKGLVAIAVENADKQANGWAVFYKTDGTYINHVEAGPLPDMITFTDDGKYVLVANEGEPSSDYSNDPEGSVTVIEVKKAGTDLDARTADFTAFNNDVPDGIRISGPGATVAQDIEPEYIATSHDSKTAWVSLQENNALAIIDIEKAEVQDLVPLGSKDHSLEGNGLDVSNDDDAINITTWPVFGTYMPDGLASFRVKGKTYIISANEGDSREYIYEADEEDCDAAGHEYDDGDCIAHLDEARVRDVDLDPLMFPDAEELQERPNLGRLKIINTEGDVDDDGDYDELHAYGARSITIWDEKAEFVADTGDAMEQVTAALLPDDFNSNHEENDSFDDRSDDKGPEPEGVVVGELNNQVFAFVGLERIGGVMIFDVTQPMAPRYVDYVNNRDFTVEDVENEDAGDLGPEGLVFISAQDSPNGKPLLVVGNEVSGSTTVYEITTL